LEAHALLFDSLEPILRARFAEGKDLNRKGYSLNGERAGIGGVLRYIENCAHDLAHFLGKTLRVFAIK